MADWQTISSLATAGGTLVLAAATFTAVRTSNRSARIAEDALRANLAPLLTASLSTDPVQKVLWGDRYATRLEGGRAIVEQVGDTIYLAIGVRNHGSGLALLNCWYAREAFTSDPPAPLDEFRRLAIDLYVAPGAAGYWESAIRQSDDPFRKTVTEAIEQREPFSVDLLYGDQFGTQRTISRFNVVPGAEGSWYAQAGRHWHLDRPAPR